jgi:hypothetical protein
VAPIAVTIDGSADRGGAENSKRDPTTVAPIPVPAVMSAVPRGMMAMVRMMTASIGLGGRDDRRRRQGGSEHRRRNNLAHEISPSFFAARSTLW